MKVVGQTVDGKDVWAGLYDLYQTHGVPMSLTLSAFFPDVPSWPHEVIAMRKHGIADAGILARLTEAIDDSTVPPAWGDGAKKGLKGML